MNVLKLFWETSDVDKVMANSILTELISTALVVINKKHLRTNFLQFLKVKRRIILLKVHSTSDAESKENLFQNWNLSRLALTICFSRALNRLNSKIWSTLKLQTAKNAMEARHTQDNLEYQKVIVIANAKQELTPTILISVEVPHILVCIHSNHQMRRHQCQLWPKGASRISISTWTC